MSKAGEVLLSLIRKNIDRYSWTVLPNYAELCVARSINSCGVVGAALAGKRSADLAEIRKVDDGDAATEQSDNVKTWALVASGGSVLLSLWGLWCSRSKNSVSLFRQQMCQLLGSVGFGVYLLYFSNKPTKAT